MRRREGTVVMTAIGLVALLLTSPSVAMACTCTGPVGRAALDKSAAMFTGTAISVEFLEPDRDGVEPPILVTFRVSEVWKGPVKRTLKLRTIHNKWTCQGSSFTEGGAYLVTAYQSRPAAEGRPAEVSDVNTCGGTRVIEHAKDVLTELGPGKKPSDDPAR